MDASEPAGLLEPWLSAAETGSVDPDFAMECVAWAYALPRLASVLSAAPWHETLDCLTACSRRAGGEDISDRPLACQLLAGELPLVLAYLFPELPSCRKLRRLALDNLSGGLDELLDGNGMPAARHVPVLRPLLACWTRCGYLARALGPRSLGKQARLRYEWFVRRALQLTRQDGRAILGDDGRDKHVHELVDAATMLAGDPDDAAIADQVLPGRKSARKKSRRDVVFPASAAHSEWGGIAILRPNWLRGGSHLTMAYPGSSMDTELNCGSTTVWSGPWSTSIRADGQPLEIQGDWEELCWFSDDDVDYLELEADLGEDWFLQRQLLMAREDAFLFLADALLGPSAAEIEYTSVLPLGREVRFQPEPETREGYLVADRRAALVLPLALPEWRSQPGDGRLHVVREGLEMRTTARAARLYAPLFVDLDRKRMGKRRTWRRLTVAQNLAAEPPSAAVAYRVQVADRQWLFYRSLAPPANRTVLGQNLSNEFFAARFGRDGETSELIGISPAD